MAQNVSAAVFHEMLTLIQFAPRNATRAKFMQDLKQCDLVSFICIDLTCD